VNRGSLVVPFHTLTLFGSIQPKTLKKYWDKATKSGDAEDGFLQRFALMVAPVLSSVVRLVDRPVNREAQTQYYQLATYFDRLDAAGLEADTSRKIPTLHFGAPAQLIFNEWHHELETRLRADALDGAIRCHLAKYRKLIPSLSLLFHLMDRCPGPVSENAVRRAIEWSRYLESHAVHVYGNILSGEPNDLRNMARHIRNGDLGTTFSIRDVERNGWVGLKDRGVILACAGQFVDLGWLRSVPEPAGKEGRPKSPTFQINPVVLPRPRDEESKGGSVSSVSANDAPDEQFTLESDDDSLRI